MASRARLSLPDRDAAEPERPPPALPSELLEEILLRVASPADLARAATACVSFRGIIADQAFLRRYRSIHPPLLLGFVRRFGFHPVEATNPSAAVARAVSFSFDYLPRTNSLDVLVPSDVRDGCVLLQSTLCDLLLCDPLSRRYLLLPPPITNDLLASVGIKDQDIIRSGPSCIRSRRTEGDTSFTLISWTASWSRLGVFIFSSDSGCWRVGTSISWGDLGFDEVDLLFQEKCTYDSLYWKLNYMSTVVKLDMNTMQFSTIGLPPDHEERQIVIVESGESRVAMLSTIYESTSVDYYSFSQNDSDKSHEWHLKSTIPLPAKFIHYIGGPAEGYIFIRCFSDEECFLDQEDTTYSECFSLEIKSLNIERVSGTPSCSYPYFGFPPFLSPRWI